MDWKAVLVPLAAALLWGCTHAEPQLVRVFEQVNRVYDPAARAWTPRLSVFVQAASGDGTKVFDRLYLLNDEAQLYIPLKKDQWTSSDKQGEFWLGTNGITFDGEVPTGTWRALLITRSGQKAESTFAVNPPRPGDPAPRNGRVSLKRLSGTRWEVSGWVDDYLLWPRDAEGVVLARTKTVGAAFNVPPNAKTVTLYSYDKVRGEGLIAGPFSVQEGSVSADR